MELVLPLPVQSTEFHWAWLVWRRRRRALARSYRYRRATTTGPPARAPPDAAVVLGFGSIREYAAGHTGSGDIDSGPVLLGVSVSATGFALAPLRAFGHRAAFERIYRTTHLFGVPTRGAGRARFTTGGPIGNALLLALLTSGPEVAP